MGSLVIEDSKEVKCALLRCTVCEESYTEDRVPRNLSCGHCLCTACTNQCLTTDWQCPECHTLQMAKDATELPINYPLMKLSQMVVKNKGSLKDIVGTLPLAPVPVPSHDQVYPLKCPVHNSPTAFFCIRCSIWVCCDCLIVDHPCLPRGNCRIISIAEAIERIRKKYKKETNVLVGQVKSIKHLLEPELARLNFIEKHCHSDNRSHRRLNGIINGMLDKLKKEDESMGNSAMTSMKKSLKVMKKTTSAEETTTLCKELVGVGIELKNVAENTTRKDTLRHEILVHLKMDLKLLLEGRKPVYAVLQDPSGAKWTQLVSRNNQQMVYSLREGMPPEDGIIIPYEYVREMLPKNYPAVFFVFGTEIEIKGFVRVRLHRNCPRIRNVVSLCSGEGKFCYRGTRVFQGKEKNTFQGGDLEKNDGTGSKNTLHSSDDYTTQENFKGFSGCLFTGVGRSFSNFGFDFRKTSFFNHISTHISMGIVTHGEDIVKAMCDGRSLEDHLVRECGFFLPRDIDDLSTTEEALTAADKINIYLDDYEDWVDDAWY